MKSNTAVAVLVSLLAGAIIGYSFKLSGDQTSVSGSALVTPSDYDNGIRKLQNISETEVAEYYRLKTMEERYAKADELLGKMMTIFLADLGIKLANETQVAMKEPLLASSDTAAAPVKNLPANSSSPSKNLVSTQGIGAPGGKLVAPSNRKSLDDVRGDAEVDKFLKDSRSENFDDLMRSSNPYANRSGTMEALRGTFRGAGMVNIGGDTKTWEYEIRFNGRLEKGELRGFHQVLVSENGEVFSNTRGRGDLSGDYRELPSDPHAILVPVGSFLFLQFYYLKSEDAIIGNVYRKAQSTAPFKVVGQFRLNR